MLRFQTTTTGTVPADISDLDGFAGKRGQAESDAD